MGDSNGNGSRCLDAFTVALSHGRSGGERRWYTSTIELQLASLDFCLVFRKVPTSRIRMDSGIPCCTWITLSDEQQQQPRESSPENRDSSRVPPLRVSRVKWLLPYWILRPDRMGTWRRVEELDLRGDRPERVGFLSLPPNLKRLTLMMGVFEPFPDWVWPASLQRLELVGFDHSIVGVAWPPALRQLSLGDLFNQSVAGVVWPASLEQLSFGYSFYSFSTVEVEESSTLTRLGSRCSFNQPIVQVVWPASLLSLDLGHRFTQPVADVVWPSSLQQLTFGAAFNQPIVEVVWPTSLLKLRLGLGFNQPIVGVVWPASLQQLSFGAKFNQPILGVVWPASMRQLEFGGDFNQAIVEVMWPACLRQLAFGTKFNQPMSE